MDFNTIWQPLLHNGSSSKKEEGTRRYWLTLSDQQQTSAFNNITRKLAAGDFVHFDPIRAIRDNIRQVKTPAPTNYRGRPIPPGIRVRSAAYNGVFGMYTQDDIDRYHLTLPVDQ